MKWVLEIQTAPGVSCITRNLMFFVRLSNKCDSLETLEEEMKPEGMALDYYLIDGDINGRIKVSSPVLPVEALKIPADKIDSSAKLNDLKNSGIYILVSKDRLYVGQASERANKTSFVSRWREHIRSGRDWFTEAIAFYSPNKNGFTSTDLDWLEYELAQSLASISNYNLENGNQPHGVPGGLTDGKVSILKTVLSSIHLISNVLGYPFFKPCVQESSTELEYEFYDARMVIRGGKYVIKSGSVLRPTTNQKFINMREKVGIIGLNVLTDIECDTPSNAGCLVSGRATNGWTSWTRNGLTLDEIVRKNN